MELDGRRDEQAGLAASGQRMMTALDSGVSTHGEYGAGFGEPSSTNDDALMLRRRLDDMNRRWHGLRAKTVAIRFVIHPTPPFFNLSKKSPFKTCGDPMYLNEIGYIFFLIMDIEWGLD